MIVKVPCRNCAQTGTYSSPYVSPRPCWKCKGTGMMDEKVPDPSHDMGEWRNEIRSPAGTARFYDVRKCKKCGEEELIHVAGHFLNDLEKPCPGG